MSVTGDLDLEVSHDREEGELADSDVEEGTYIPLARPEAFNPPSLVHMQIQDEQSDEASPQESSCSDSDEEIRRRAKRTKLRPRRPPPPQHPAMKEKYNVWCKALQEELLTEDMVSCDVSKKKTRYGVESYDYTIKYRLDDNSASKKIFTSSNDINRTSNKRRHQDRSNIKLRLGKRVNSHKFKEVKEDPKYLENLTVTLEDPAAVIASDMADKLNEEKKDLIERIVQVLGAGKAVEVYKETQRVEADGGILVMNGTRRRTPGGVFFFLLKGDNTISPEMMSQIFTEDKREAQRKIKRTRQTRQKVVEQLKQTLTDSEIPSLSRSESTVQSEHGSNPPPSPATDARDCSSDTDAHSHTDRPASPGDPLASPGDPLARPDPRALQDYEDGDYLEVMCNDEMDLF